ncbi:MAG: PorV/PorQ family protein [Elusimicrobia bacterium]|nr:PorV/PorQ family protein [Elusimicrobiota bacterium]
MHLKWFSDINYDYAAFAFPYENWGFGISYHNLSMDEIQKYDINDILLNETYSPSDSMVTIAASYCINEKLSFGSNLKYINSKIESTYASTIAGDAGIIYSGLKSFDFGLSVQNFGGKLKYVQTQEDLPLNFKAGIGYHGNNEKNIIPKVYVDLNQGIENKLYVSAGTECDFFLKPGWGGSLRAGYRSRDINYAVNGFSAGGGIMFNDNIKIDFAWVPYGELGDTYSVSFIFILNDLFYGNSRK